MGKESRMLGVKRMLFGQLARLAECSAGEVGDALEACATDNAVWRVAHPINTVKGTHEAVGKVWQPLKKALPDLERRDVIFVGGTYEERDYVAAVGHYCGVFKEDWLTIPKTNKAVYLRYGEAYQIEDGKIVEATLLWDILDFMRQAGCCPISPSLGVEGMWPGPITANGVALWETDDRTSAESLSQTLAMHRTLLEFDDRSLSRDTLLSMPQKQHWHEKMMWYGPAGIGAARSLQGFVDCHQLPFRIAFQRPQGSAEEVRAEGARHNAGHYIRIGDGPYSVTGGWPSVCAIHNGAGFAGREPTGKQVTMRVMDFYLHHEGKIRENWVPLDMLDLLNQMGFDVIAHMQNKHGRANGISS